MKSIIAAALLTAAVLAQDDNNPTCSPGPCVSPEVTALESSECQQYHVFIARGSDSGYPGHLGPLVKEICDGLEDCGYENIVYPANSSYAGPGMWCKSAYIGATAGQEQLKSYAEKCPDSKLILTGFSQGGSVALDILGGGGGPGFHCEDQQDSPPLDRNEVPGSHIVAALVFGAVVRAADQEYTVELERTLSAGQSAREFNGTQTRRPESVEAVNAYADILREYCNAKDPVCAKGGADASVDEHLNYFDLYNGDAAKWTIAKATGQDFEEEESSGGQLRGNDNIKESSKTASGTASATSMEQNATESATSGAVTFASFSWLLAALPALACVAL
ncbi:carbohydrate esterase family 5 protein [Sporormia fimetaria CBS 119925]|uniref:Carbohydrate esterase family 5 protein n=1 Tax=Sporormia fimetaria CBS 119925 TaxID=1340428 RepID=A0A6A6V936_9PLEO|nr:carbohydrate esterase family 5 protein [Sporormia fimetaria CBS 119925]